MCRNWPLVEGIRGMKARDAKTSMLNATKLGEAAADRYVQAGPRPTASRRLLESAGFWRLTALFPNSFLVSLSGFQCRRRVGRPHSIYRNRAALRTVFNSRIATISFRLSPMSGWFLRTSPGPDGELSAKPRTKPSRFGSKSRSRRKSGFSVPASRSRRIASPISLPRIRR